MHHDADVIIVGAGLAGAAAALVLSPHCSVHVLEGTDPAAGASGVAPGLVNPFMGRRARPVWRLHEALDAVSRLLDRANAGSLFPAQGVLRPVVEEDQEERFRNVVEEHPDLAEWWPAERVQARVPALDLDQGALFVPRGGAIDVTAMVKALLDAAEGHGAAIETSAPVVYWRETPTAAVVEVGRGPHTEELRADRVILALGQGYSTFPELRRLGLKGIKGQTVRVRRPQRVPPPFLPMSGRGYVVPEDEDTLILGSNYDHNFEDVTPEPEATAYIQEKTSRMIPGLDEAHVLDVQAGIRVKHEEKNLPLLGPMPGRERLWTFTALGSKGLLTAPLLALDLPEALERPASIPKAVRTAELGS